MTSYLTASDARTLAASLTGLPGFSALLALDDTALLGVLLTASMDIDMAERYQGRRYDPTQDMEFPRIDASPAARQYPPAPPSINDPSFYVFGGAPTFIYDWDPNANGGAGAAVVPTNVKLATLYQSAWLMQPKYAARLEAIRSGLAAQSTGEASETNIKAGEAVPGGFTGLGDRASKIMDRYRIRTGRLL